MGLVKIESWRAFRPLMQAALGVGDASMVARTIPFTTSACLDREVHDRAYRGARNGFRYLPRFA
jgi:hypothetical protein